MTININTDIELVILYLFFFKVILKYQLQLNFFVVFSMTNNPKINIKF